MQRVSPLNSQKTLLVNDYDLENIAKYACDYVSGVMFADINVKNEFSFDVNTGEVTPGEAVIFAERILSTPINNEIIPVKFTSDATVVVDTTVGNKVYIELDNTLIQNQDDIVDVPPSTNYALGLDIGQIKSTASYPAHNNYLKLWEIEAGPIANDVRVKLDIKGDNVNMENMTRDIHTTGDIYGDTITSPQGNFTNINLGGSDLQTTINDITSGLTGLNNIIPIQFGEDIQQYQVGFVGRNTVRSAVSIGNNVNNASVTFGRITENKVGQEFTTTAMLAVPRFTVRLLKVGSPTDDITVKLRDETRTTEIATSISLVSGTSLSTTAWADYVFDFDSSLTPIQPNTKYFFEVYRTGANDNANYYTVAISNLAPYTDGEMYINIAGSRVATPANDMYFAYTPKHKYGLCYYSLKNYADQNICDVITLQSGLLGETKNVMVAGSNSGFSNLVPGNNYYVGANYTISSNYIPNGTAQAFGTVAIQKVADIFRFNSVPLTGASSKSIIARNLKIRLRKVGNPTDNATIRIETGSGGSTAYIPTGTLIDTNAYIDVPGTSLTTSFVDYEFLYPAPINVTKDTDIFLVLGRSGANDNANYYEVDVYSGEVYYNQTCTGSVDKTPYFGDNPRLTSTTGICNAGRWTTLYAGIYTGTCTATQPLPNDTEAQQMKTFNGSAWARNLSVTFKNSGSISNYNHCGTFYAGPITVSYYGLFLKQIGFTIDDITISPSSNLDVSGGDLVGRALTDTTLVMHND